MKISKKNNITKKFLKKILEIFFSIIKTQMFKKNILKSISSISMSVSFKNFLAIK